MAGELQLALAHELTPQNAPLFAADIVAQAATKGVVLDFSASTLHYLDSVTASLRAAGVTLEQVPEVLFGFGCVLGECITRASDAEWVPTSFDVPIGLRLGAITLDPVGFAFATLKSGRTYHAFFAGALSA